MNLHHGNMVPVIADIVVVIVHRPEYDCSMQRLQACQFEWMPDGQQQREMRRFAGTCCIVCNKALAAQKGHHAAADKFTGSMPIVPRSSTWKRQAGHAWLRDAGLQVLQPAWNDLNNACQNFCVRHAGVTCLKRRGSAKSVRNPGPQQLRREGDNCRIPLSQSGRLRYRNSRDMPGLVHNATVNQAGSKWFQPEQEVVQRFPTAATGIAHTRHDFLHNLTTTISRNHAPVRIEDLQVRNMTSLSEASTGEQGKRMKQDVRPGPPLSRSGLGPVQTAVSTSWGIRQHAAGGAPSQHQSYLPDLCTWINRQLASTDKVAVHGMRLRPSRRCRWRNHGVRAGTSFVSLGRWGAARPHAEAGTDQSDTQRRSNPGPFGWEKWKTIKARLLPGRALSHCALQGVVSRSK